jgi:hypothetical protein
MLDGMANDPFPEINRTEVRRSEAPAEQAVTLTIGRVTYTVEHVDGEHIAYELRGPRGAHYGLMRNANNLHLFFMVNLADFTRKVPHTWFSDKSGHLTAVTLL